MATLVEHYTGLSTDAKPGFVPVGSTFYETDTDVTYTYRALGASSYSWQAGNVSTDELGDDAVTNAKLADDAVDSAQIADGAVDGVHLSSTMTMKIATVHVAHDAASGTADIALPARSLLHWAFAVCTESAAGNPDVDFGVEGGDTDGLFDDLGANCATAGGTLGASPAATGVGDDIALTTADDPTAIKAWYAAATTLTNTRNAAGTAGEWDVWVCYSTLPAN